MTTQPQPPLASPAEAAVVVAIALAFLRWPDRALQELLFPPTVAGGLVGAALCGAATLA